MDLKYYKIRNLSKIDTYKIFFQILFVILSYSFGNAL